jgi:hypothetical protein
VAGKVRGELGAPLLFALNAVGADSTRPPVATAHVCLVTVVADAMAAASRRNEQER